MRRCPNRGHRAPVAYPRLVHGDDPQANRVAGGEGWISRTGISIETAMYRRHPGSDEPTRPAFEWGEVTHALPTALFVLSGTGTVHNASTGSGTAATSLTPAATAPGCANRRTCSDCARRRPRGARHDRRAGCPDAVEIADGVRVGCADRVTADLLLDDHCKALVHGPVFVQAFGAGGAFPRPASDSPGEPRCPMRK